jgi:selenide,water dikinase
VITPIVDNPYQFGQIAAANALSDVYAMGGRPITGLNIVGFPRGELPLSVLAEILRGGSDKFAEAGAMIVGGHTIDDREPKYGLAVTGLVDPERIWRNSTGRAGDRLVLTKPLGTGVIATAIKREAGSPQLVDFAIRSMASLNQAAAAAAAAIGVHAVTDVTGFGLLGHLHELAAASGVAAWIDGGSVPAFPGVWELVAADVVPGGTRRNLDHASMFTSFEAGVSESLRLVLADAQTSGGLLIAVEPNRATALASALVRSGVAAAAEIGQLREGTAGTIIVSA